MYDFIRFIPDKKVDFGFKKYIVFLETTKIERNEFFVAHLINAEDTKELVSKLKKVKKTEIVGVFSSNVKVNREATMRRKVDVLLDGIERRLDYTTVRLAAEKDVLIEISLSKYLNVSGLKRSKLFENDLELIRIINKFNTPFAITSAASDFYEMRSKRQIQDFFSFLGVDVKKSEKHIDKLIRKYYDPNFIIDGLEIVEPLRKNNCRG